MNPPILTLATPPTPGAIAILQFAGHDAASLITAITDQTDWPIAGLRRANLAGIDEGVAARLNEETFQLMPHGGTRVVQRLIQELTARGARYEETPSPVELYPEADSRIEADALAALAAAASPVAVDLLAAQPELWRAATARSKQLDRQALARRAAILDQLITPPTVVVIGRPNVGKSTLTNRMLGRSVSLVADLPGTTRDWVAALAELMPMDAVDSQQAVAVRWLDTPGLRDSDDPIEQEAIALARQVVREAAVVIAMRDADLDWPTAEACPRTPDLWVINKIDMPDPKRAGPSSAPANAPSRSTPLPISAQTGQGLEALQQAVIAALGLDQVGHDELWVFSDCLREWVAREQDEGELAKYVGA